MLFSKVVRRFILLCFALVASLIPHVDLFGQGITTGTISGIVADSSGAVVDHDDLIGIRNARQAISEELESIPRGYDD